MDLIELLAAPLGGPAAAPAVPVQSPGPLPARTQPVDREVQAILDALWEGGDSDRRKVVRAIVLVGRRNRCHVDPNQVRAVLARADGRPDLDKPQVVGAVYNALKRHGVLEFIGWVKSTDTASGNAGRPVPAYRLVRDSFEL